MTELHKTKYITFICDPIEFPEAQDAHLSHTFVLWNGKVLVDEEISLE